MFIRLRAKPWINNANEISSGGEAEKYGIMAQIIAQCIFINACCPFGYDRFEMSTAMACKCA
jgi:hypothetical protein